VQQQTVLRRLVVCSLCLGGVSYVVCSPLPDHYP